MAIKGKQIYLVHLLLGSDNLFQNEESVNTGIRDILDDARKEKEDAAREINKAARAVEVIKDKMFNEKIGQQSLFDGEGTLFRIKPDDVSEQSANIWTERTKAVDDIRFRIAGEVGLGNLKEFHKQAGIYNRHTNAIDRLTKAQKNGAGKYRSTHY